MNTWLVAGGAVRPSLGRVGGGAGLRGWASGGTIQGGHVCSSLRMRRNVRGRGIPG